MVAVLPTLSLTRTVNVVVCARVAVPVTPVTLTGAEKSVNRDLEAKARALAGIKG
ncbi:MAG: hypothetical protein ABJA87_12745 [bacterium]